MYVVYPRLSKLTYIYNDVHFINILTKSDHHSTGRYFNFEPSHFISTYVILLYDIMIPLNIWMEKEQVPACMMSYVIL